MSKKKFSFLKANIFILFLLLFGCSQIQDRKETETIPVEQLYNKGMNLIEKGNYASAVLVFEELDRLHPYSNWTTRAQIMTVFCYYQSKLYEEAVLAAERFIQLHPASSDVPYAYYLIGLSYYQQITDVSRDQGATQLALESFEQLIQRYPSSDYAVDAKLKTDLVIAQLAGKEIEIGRYYLKKQKYLAALNRFNLVTQEYQTTHYVPEALHRLTETYIALGLLDQAQETAAVLGYNFPDSKWYEASYSMLKGKKILKKEKNGNILTQFIKKIF